jgi:hypothetical protein
MLSIDADDRAPDADAGNRTTVHRQALDDIDLLERVAADWSLLDRLPAEDLARLHRAVAGLSVPEARAARKRARREGRDVVRDGLAGLGGAVAPTRLLRQPTLKWRFANARPDRDFK